jgi:two-component system chemotaxis response regulator CheB
MRAVASQSPGAVRARTRVLVVDDSAVARRLLVRILGARDGFDVVGEAENGRDAVRLAAELRPDVVTMDIRMPVMDGYEATRRIMAAAPVPIVMVSAHQAGEVARSFGALEAGAVTVLPKPSGPASPDHDRQAEELVRTLAAMAGLRLVTRRSRSAPPATAAPRSAPARCGVVAIGASTGGPAALARILRGLPADLAAPVLVVQHIADGFDDGLANWLDSVGPLPVRLARDRDRPEPGRVLVAPNGSHMELRAGRIALADGPPVGAHRPAATRLFSSVADEGGERALGVILTGIGRDGTDGLVALRRAGGHVIAHDEATCVVYGMPRAAVEAGAVDEVLPVGEVAAAIRRAVGGA